MAQRLLGTHIAWENLSEQQHWVLNKRAEKVSVENVVKQWATRFPDLTGFGKSAFETCIISSVLGLHWNKGENIGAHPYLCQKDLVALERFIEIKCEDNEECPIDVVLQEAKRLKIARNASAVTCLRLLNHFGLSRKLEEIAVKAPSPSWVSNLNTLISVKTEQVIFIDHDRFYSCHEEVINSYFESYAQFIELYPPCLRFGADESMMQPKLSSTEVVPEDANAPLREGAPDVPHITAMCCHNCLGKSCPLFIILKQLRNLPQELSDFANQGDAWFASSSKGYMTRDLFVCWVINFVNWLSFERSKMDQSLRNQRALLITDGHLSRECPMAVKILDIHKVDLLILPSHTTHVLQMFDVVLASVMKNKFSKLFKDLISDQSLSFRTNQARLRYCIVSATISAWQHACTRSNCMAAAQKSGICPCSPDVPLVSAYVRQLTPREEEIYRARVEYAERNFVCSGKQLNSPNTFIDLTNKISQRDDLKHLLYPMIVQNHAVSMVDIPKFVRIWNFNGCKLLSKFHPFIGSDNSVVFY